MNEKATDFKTWEWASSTRSL